MELTARRLAAGLRERGVGPGDVVALQLPNWTEAAASFWATALLGAVVVPIVHFYGRKELTHILADAKPKAFITAAAFGRMVYEPDISAAVPIVGVVGGGDPVVGGDASTFDDLLADEAHGRCAGHRSGWAGIDRLHLGHHQRAKGRRAQPSQPRPRNPPAGGAEPAGTPASS